MARLLAPVPPAVVPFPACVSEALDDTIADPWRCSTERHNGNGKMLRVSGCGRGGGDLTFLAECIYRPKLNSLRRKMGQQPGRLYATRAWRCKCGRVWVGHVEFEEKPVGVTDVDAMNRGAASRKPEAQISEPAA